MDTIPDSTSGRQLSLKHHDEYWFAEGNIILAAGDVGFRVHSGVIVHGSGSPVFKDLFEYAQATPEESIDGCAVIEVTDDPEELADLLSVLYSASAIWVPTVIVTFDTIAACVHLGNKYQMDDVFEGSLDRLKSCFPTSFDDWEQLEVGDTYIRSSVMEVQVTDAIRVVNLARTCECTELLPVALYICATLSSRDLVLGVNSANLHPNDLARCVSARNNILQSLPFTSISQIMPHPLCFRESCRDKLDEFPEWLYRNRYLIDYYFLGFPKIPLAMLVDSLCRACADVVRTKFTAMRRSLWARLPEFMDSPVNNSPEA
ncbi:uncharacterized protein LAESUDRAFT_642561 [Laetiporus sulphureus 93-53]|uniref:BTB domain-containing protein n=1 Tax=Laetiporus sulphureus 93-53 TaxID=1314785 RepID=A0A165H2T7_9APHY|nr:uncharacterized protein LAESUDRAFT_642561 [Laetiporus sulphureus 93-53]KZT11166.1 hypothetical protein LAESUDRAFT_642561 [Laetiporus sulphureus 93-53]